MGKQFLYLSDYELRIVWTNGKTLTEKHCFQTTENGESEFAYYLSNAPKKPISCLLDTTQEEYQLTYLPHVRGKDRRYLMAHKLKRLFEDNPYRYGILQGRETQGRRDDRVLFMGLNNPSFLQPWLDLLIAHQIPLLGIYSLPLLSQYLLGYLPKAPYTLLVTHTPPIKTDTLIGLRQSLFFHRKLQFSRLVPLNTLDPEQYVENILNQIFRIKCI